MRKPVHLRQSQPGAFAQRLGREEWLENTRQNVRRDADTGVGHRQCDEVALKLIDSVAFLERDVARREGNRAAAGHGVARIDRDIDQRQFEFRNIDLDRPDLVRDIAFELHVSAQRADQHFVHGLDTLLEIGDDGIERLAARERQ